MIIAFFFLITIFVAAYSFAPLMSPRQQWLTAVNQEEARRALEAEKESCLLALKDIEFEHASNKINDQDFADLKKYYRTKTAKAMKKLEDFDIEGPDTPAPAPNTASGPEPDLQPAEPKPEDNITAQLSDTGLDPDVRALKNKIEKLTVSWESGELSEDDYTVLYDHYSTSLEKILKQNEKPGPDSPVY